MAKRKRMLKWSAPVETVPAKKAKSVPSTQAKASSAPVTIQIIAGSYYGTLHGIVATLSPEVEFADSFLFAAHQSALKCLTLSPPSAPQKNSLQKVILATGSTDERIQLYHLSAHPPPTSDQPSIPSLTGKKIVQDPQNRELGVLSHHSSGVTALNFPTRSKLMSASDDSTIAVTRTRDWSLLSKIKAPIPKPVGRPSGDTAPLGGTPSGVNDFAVHSSLKLMVTVSKGEKSMRLWNLLTGKKAGVLNFGREMLAEIGEGKFSSGEGRKVAWGSTGDGEEFCVGFDRGVLIFGMDSKVKCKIVGRTKIHQLRYVEGEGEDDQLLAISTEDGRILFYSTREEDSAKEVSAQGKEADIPCAKLVAQLGGKSAGVSNRIKDFIVLGPKPEDGGEEGTKIIITAESNGTIRIWKLVTQELSSASKDKEAKEPKQVGTLWGATETGEENRILCLAAYVMVARPAGAKEEVIVEEQLDGEESSESESDSEDDE